MFWERGRCDRGLNCKFYHDTKWRQHDAPIHETAARDLELELQVYLAHAAALLQRRTACRHALDRVDALRGLIGDGAAEERDMKKMRRAELGRDAERLRAYMAGVVRCVKGKEAEQKKEKKEKKAKTAMVKGNKGGEEEEEAAKVAHELTSFMSRSLLFSTRLDGGGDAAAAEAGSPDCSKRAVARRLLDGLSDTFGLPQAERLGLSLAGECKRRLKRCVTLRYSRYSCYPKRRLKLCVYPRRVTAVTERDGSVTVRRRSRRSVTVV